MVHDGRFWSQFYAKVELRDLIERVQHASFEAQIAALSQFVTKSLCHREAARLYLDTLERRRHAGQRMRSWGFADGVRVPGSNLRRIDRNRRRK